MDDVKKDSFPRLPKLELIFSKNYSRARCTTVQFVMILTALYASLIPSTLLYSSDSEGENVPVAVDDPQEYQTRQAGHDKRYQNNS